MSSLVDEILLLKFICPVIFCFLGRSMSSDNGGATKALTFGTHTDPRQDLSLMCGMLVPTLERLELLSEVRYLISVYCL